MAEQQDLFKKRDRFDPHAVESDITQNRHRGADTSVQAFKTTPSAFRTKQRKDIWNYLDKNGGHTAEEISFALAMSYNSVSARLAEMKRDKLVVDTGVRRATTHGKNARVMAARGIVLKP